MLHNSFQLFVYSKPTLTLEYYICMFKFLYHTALYLTVYHAAYCIHFFMRLTTDLSCHFFNLQSSLSFYQPTQRSLLLPTHTAFFPVSPPTML